MSEYEPIIGEKFRALYDLIVDNFYLTLEQLRSISLNLSEIEVLISLNILKRLDGKYYFVDADRLFRYGKFLVTNKEYEKSKKVFKKVISIDPEFEPAYFLLFYENLYDENLNETAYFCIRKLMQTKDESFKRDINTFLLILNEVYLLPKDINEYARTIGYMDIMPYYEDVRHSEEDTIRITSIRDAIYKRKFSYAYKQIVSFCNECKQCTSEDLATKTLLFLGANTHVRNQKYFDKLVAEKEYEELLMFLIDEEQKHELKTSYEYSKKILVDYFEIKNTRIVPASVMNDNPNVFKAIDYKNYHEALELSKEGLGVLHPLLVDICALIDEVDKEKSLNR